MSEGIIVALIGAAGLVIAAIIGLLKKGNDNKTSVKQHSEGQDIIQIGIHVDKKEESKGHE